MNMKKALFAGAFAIMLCTALSACGASSTAMNANISEPAEAASELVIEAKNYEFDKTEYRVKKGEAIKISVKSTSGFHGIKINDTSYSIKSDESKILSFDKAGTYDIHCNIACGSGHTKMKATIIVE